MWTEIIRCHNHEHQCGQSKDVQKETAGFIEICTPSESFPVPLVIDPDCRAVRIEKQRVKR